MDSEHFAIKCDEVNNSVIQDMLALILRLNIVRLSVMSIVLGMIAFGITLRNPAIGKFKQPCFRMLDVL
jgi:hypothetical protein